LWQAHLPAPSRADGLRFTRSGHRRPRSHAPRETARPDAPRRARRRTQSFPDRRRSVSCRWRVAPAGQPPDAILPSSLLDPPSPFPLRPV
jgi:hypothetical protein